MKGHFTPHTQETKLRISVAKKGVPNLKKRTGETRVCCCGNKFYLKLSQIKKSNRIGTGKFCSRVCFGISQKGKKLSEKTKNKIGESHRGEKAYQWISDRTKLSKSDEFRNSAAHREWSKQVKNRDYWRCQIANDDCSGRVEAHHILGWRDHPELRYVIKNGITLCHFHHPRKRADEERYVDQFQQLVAAKMQ